MSNSRWQMSATPVALALVLLLSGAPSPARPSEGGFVPLSEVIPGDRCVARSVFSGDEVEEFAVEILAIVPGTSPGGNLIIGRAEGELFDEYGIMQGMSGSPVYLDGRLVGAISSTWAFSKQPIAGITPIEEMLPALESMDDRVRAAASGGAPLRLALTPPGDAGSRARWLASVATGGLDLSADPVGTPGAVYAGRPMAPIGVPLVVPGGEAFASAVSGALGELGFRPVAAAGAASESSGERSRLVPGSAVGAQLVRGDVDITAVGTVTHVDGDRILAFGHSLFNAGSVEVPLVEARVHALMPLQSVSFKYASAGDVVGTLLQDNNRMVAGVLGPPPEMIPVALTVEVGETSKEFSFEVARARTYSAAFTGLAVSSAVSEAAKSSGPSTIALEAVVRTDSETIEYDDLFYSSAPAFAASAELSALMNLVLFNRFEERRIDGVSLRVSIREERLSAEIERVDADRAVYAPGDTVGVTVTLARWQGESERLTAELTLPSSTPDGPLTLAVSGPAEFHESEAMRLGNGLAPRSYDQLLALVERSRPGDSVSVQLLSGAPGVSLSGSELRDVPARAAMVMAAAGRGGAVDRTEQAEVASKHLRTGSSVSGYFELTLHVQRDRR